LFRVQTLLMRPIRPPRNGPIDRNELKTRQGSSRRARPKLGFSYRQPHLKVGRIDRGRGFAVYRQSIEWTTIDS